MIHLAMATPGIGAEEFPCDILSPFFYQDDILARPLPIEGAGRAAGAPRPGVERTRTRCSATGSSPEPGDQPACSIEMKLSDLYQHSIRYGAPRRAGPGGLRRP